MSETKIYIPQHPDIGAYIFDLDGTLVDTEILWVEATADFLRSKGKEVSDEQVAAWVQGRSWDDIYLSLVAEWPEMDIGVDELDYEMRPFFDRLCESCDVRIHNSIAVLESVARHTPTVIVSGSPRSAIKEAVEVMEIGSSLKFYLGSADYSPGKPHPACFLMAAEKLNVAPECCVVFEDSTAGVNAAVNAGMPVVALVRPGAPQQDIAAANLILEDLSLYTPEMLFKQATT